jgi:lipopolysaccharide biosynthesis regulator YciM
MHQNLVEREGLREEQRLQALTELGHDFLKAGLLDRAEEIFLRLRDTARDEEALTFLLEIYQQEKEWRKAIDIARRLPDHSGHLWQKEIANFYCELAAARINNSRPEEAQGLLEEALATHRKSVRATILLGDLNAARGDYEAAIEAWKRIEQQNPVYLSLVAAKLMEAYRKLGRSREGLQLLRGYLAQHPSLDMLDAAFQWTLEDESPEAAYQLVREELRRNPTLLGLDKLLEAQVLVAPPERRAELELTRNLIHGHTRKVARYRCDGCGFKARQFYWRCPGCGAWESYPPKRTEEFDLTP